MLHLTDPTPRVRAILRTYPEDAATVAALAFTAPVEGSVHLDRATDRAPFLAVIRTEGREYRGTGRMPSDAVAMALRLVAA